MLPLPEMGKSQRSPHWDLPAGATQSPLRERLEALLKKLARKRVLVVGDVGIDRYTLGSVTRISPEAPVPIVWVREEKLKLGLAANVADNVRALGGEAWLVGVVGHDRGGDDLRDLLRTNGISDRHLVQDASRRTIIKERVLGENQQLLRIDYESLEPITEKVRRNLLNEIRDSLHDADIVILEDYAKGLLTQDAARELFEMCKKAGRQVTVDPNAKSPLSLYRGASVLTPNTREAELLSGIPIRDRISLRRAGQALLEGTGASHVVITRGKDGMAIFTAHNPDVTEIPTYAREVFDVSGAGDTVIAVLSLALAAGASIEDAALLGNVAAGVEVGKRGTATVSPQEVRQMMRFLESVGLHG